MSAWEVKIITGYPDFFPGPLSQSLIGKALNDKIWSLEVINLHDFANDDRGSIDDSPFGGGPGMIIKPDVAENAIKKSLENMETELPLVYMTPVGRPLVQKTLKNFSNGPGIRILCGRFEGVDERVLDAYNINRISLGDFVLSGGEVAAIVLVEGCVRLLPKVLGESGSLSVESFNNNLLEYPQYTRPEVWIDGNNKKHKVPEILLSGHHEKINKWREKKSKEITKKLRPDLLKKKI